MIYHVPVMAQEIVEALRVNPGDTVVDATLGGGGHAAILGSLAGPNGVLIGIDRDTDALSEASGRLQAIGYELRPRIEYVHARYDRAFDEIRQRGFESVNAILFDLGVSSHQLDEPSRGFSFKDPSAPLDMRMDQSSGEQSAADLLNELPERELTRIFRDYADERWAARIAQFVADRRKGAPYATAGQLTETIMAAIPAAARPKDIHPGTRVFQALRIAVNHEFEALELALRKAIDLLASGGRIAVLSYHSGEDRIVKNSFAVLSGKCVCPPEYPACQCEAKAPKVSIVTRKPIGPESLEIANNPRARSAKLRIAERL
jgi:16S rRNA (cytosine1402-N4)-methyltransferase